jgi:hypothetical protein
MAEEKGLSKFIGEIQARFPHARLVIWVVILVQVLWRAFNGVGNMIDIYGHAQFLAQHQKETLEALKTGIVAFFSPTGSIITFLIGFSFLRFVPRAKKVTAVGLAPLKTGDGEFGLVVASGITSTYVLPPPTWQVSASDVLKVIDILQNHPSLGPPSIKIVTTRGGRELAEILLKVFQIVRWPLIENSDEATYFFPAKNDDAAGIIFRHRKKLPPGVAVHLLGVCSSLNVVASRQYTEQEFPDTDNYNFFQLDIGNPRPALLLGDS